MKWVVVAGLGSVLLCAPSAQSAEFGWASKDGWVVVDGADYCGMTREYEGAGSTSLALMSHIDGAVTVSLSNANWSTHDGEKLELVFQFDRKRYWTVNAVGLRLDGARGGFFADVDREFLADVAAASDLRVYRKETKTLVDQLDLTGSRASGSKLAACRVQLSARLSAEAREKERLAHIPVDPFASAGKSAPDPSKEH
jgi:hypothetical protein